MAEDSQQAAIAGLRTRGVELEVMDSGRLTGERRLCYFIGGNLGP